MRGSRTPGAVPEVAGVMPGEHAKGVRLTAGVRHPARSGSRVTVTVESLNKVTMGQRKNLERRVARVGEVAEGKAQLAGGPGSMGSPPGRAGPPLSGGPDFAEPFRPLPSQCLGR